MPLQKKLPGGVSLVSQCGGRECLQSESCALYPSHTTIIWASREGPGDTPMFFITLRISEILGW